MRVTTNAQSAPSVTTSGADVSREVVIVAQPEPPFELSPNPSLVPSPPSPKPPGHDGYE
jgi:hypothetical protein